MELNLNHYHCVSFRSPSCDRSVTYVKWYAQDWPTFKSFSNNLNLSCILFTNKSIQCCIFLTCQMWCPFPRWRRGVRSTLLLDTRLLKTWVLPENPGTRRGRLPSSVTLPKLYPCSTTSRMLQHKPWQIWTHYWETCGHINTLSACTALCRDPSTHHLDRFKLFCTGRNITGQAQTYGAKICFEYGCHMFVVVF